MLYMQLIRTLNIYLFFVAVWVSFCSGFDSAAIAKILWWVFVFGSFIIPLMFLGYGTHYIVTIQM